MNDHVVVRLEVEHMRSTLLTHLRLRQKDLEAALEKALEGALRDDFLTENLAVFTRQVVDKLLKEELERAIRFQLPRDERFQKLIEEIVAGAMKPNL